MSNTTLTDAQLVAGHLAGDRSAFAAIYDRFADSLYDTAAAMVRNRHDAADVMQDVFVVAAERMEQLRDPDRLKPWLFAILRNEVYRRSGQKQRTVATDFTDAAAEMALPSQPADEGSDLEYQELAELVRGAAAGLDERDQLVLEYSVRRGLQGDDLADALGVSAQQCYGLVHRMRQRTERSLGAYCVARRGRKECPELADILSGWDGEFSVLIRKRVARHVDQCETCERSRRKLAPLALFGAAPAFAAPPDLRDRVLAAAGHGSANPAYGFTAPGGFPAVSRFARRLGLWIILGIVALLVAGGTTAYMLTGGDDDRLATADAATPTTVGIGTTTTSPTTTAAGTSAAAAAPPIDTDTTTTTTTAGTTTADPGPSTTTSTSLPSVSVLPPVDRKATTTTAAPTTTTTPTATPATTTPPATTPVTTTPATTTPATTTPPTTLAPGSLSISAGAIDFGTTLERARITLSNSGGQSLTWSSSSGPAAFRGVATAFTSSPTTGTLAPGEAVDVTIVIDRTWPVEGPVEPTSLTFVAAGTNAVVTLTATIARPPVVDIVVSPPTTQCATATNLRWEVSIDDETTPITAVLRIGLPDATAISVPLTERGALWYGSTPLNPGGGRVQLGVWDWTLVATDGFGNATNVSGSTDVQRDYC